VPLTRSFRQRTLAEAGGPLRRDACKNLAPSVRIGVDFRLIFQASIILIVFYKSEKVAPEAAGFPSYK
jgi:hypothetical protein